MSLPRLAVRRLGTVPYEAAFALQGELRQQRLEDAIPDTLLLLQHPPTLTITRRHGRTNVLVDDAELAMQGIQLLQVDRGGDVTAHAPGQLVAYPIIKLEGVERDLPKYLRALEQAAMDVLAAHGLVGERIAGESGVFMQPREPGGRMEKVCAMGVKGTRFVMSHGLALNVRTQLDIFGLIVPCGLHHRGVTSMEKHLGDATPSVDAVADLMAPALARALGRTLDG